MVEKTRKAQLFQRKQNGKSKSCTEKGNDMFYEKQK